MVRVINDASEISLIRVFEYTETNPLSHHQLNDYKNTDKEAFTRNCDLVVI